MYSIVNVYASPSRTSSDTNINHDGSSTVIVLIISSVTKLDQQVGTSKIRSRNSRANC
jgi:hypothetical protein